MNMATFVSFIQWEGAVFSLLEIGERLFVAGGLLSFVSVHLAITIYESVCDVYVEIVWSVASEY